MIKTGDKRLQGLQAVTRGYKVLQGERKDCRTLQGVSKSSIRYRWLQGV